MLCSRGFSTQLTTAVRAVTAVQQEPRKLSSLQQWQQLGDHSFFGMIIANGICRSLHLHWLLPRILSWAIPFANGFCGACTSAVFVILGVLSVDVSTRLALFWQCSMWRLSKRLRRALVTRRFPRTYHGDAAVADTTCCPQETWLIFCHVLHALDAPGHGQRAGLCWTVQFDDTLCSVCYSRTPLCGGLP